MKNGVMGINFAFCILQVVFNVYIPLESHFPELIDELRVRGIALVRYPNVRNYWVNEVPAPEGVTGWLTSKVYSPIFSVEGWVDSVDVVRPTAFIYYRGCKQGVSPCLNIVLEPVTNFGENSAWPNRKFKGLFAADYERAFVNLYNKKFSLILGREKFGVGPSPRYNLLLSGYSPPLDGVFASYEDTKFKLSFIFSRFENMKSETLNFEGDTIHTDIANSKRFVSIRRLDFLPKDWINIGLTEVAIYGGPSGLPSFYYLNPIALSFPYEFTCDGANHNIFWDIDGRIDFPNLSIYGEFLMDDFQYQKDPQNEPNHIGLLIGVEKALKQVFILTEYTRVSRWVYNHYVPWQRYKYLGYPVGHPFGPDFDNLFFKLTHHYSAKLDFYGMFSYTRHGASRIETTWPIPEIPRRPGTYFPTNNFLSPPITNYIDIKLGINFFCRGRAWRVPTTRRNLRIATTLSGEVGFCKSSDEGYLPTFKIKFTVGSS